MAFGRLLLWLAERIEPIRIPADQVLDKTTDIPDDRAPPLAPVEAQAEGETGSAAKARSVARGVGKVAEWLRHATQFFVTQS